MPRMEGFDVIDARNGRNQTLGSAGTPRMAAIKLGNAVKERPSVAMTGYRILRKSAVAVCQEFS
jgi:hypothetical protein